MSRYTDDGDADYMNAGEMWAHNVEQVLRGKRGRKALMELREALLALPEKRLISDALCTVNVPDEEISKPEAWVPGTPYKEHQAKTVAWDQVKVLKEQGRGVCAVGAYAWWKKVKAGMDPEEAFADLPVLTSDNSDMWETVSVGKAAGLVGVLAWELAYTNDEEAGGLSPEARYEWFIQWIDQCLAAPPLTRPRRREKPVKAVRGPAPIPSDQPTLAGIL